MKLGTNQRWPRLVVAPLAATMLVATFSIGIAAPAATAAPVAGGGSEYELNVGGHVTQLSEGQTVSYDMQLLTPVSTSGAVPNVQYPGDGGILTVTASDGVYHYSIAMSVPATNFVGAFTITDLTSGLSGGSTPELVFAGDVPTSKLRGHKYSGSLTGTAFFLGTPVAAPVPNYTIYTY
jgi:hypothetical protein